MKLSQLAQLINAELIGDPDAEIIRANSFDQAGEGDVTLAADAKYLAKINQSPATAIIVAVRVDDDSKNLLRARNARLAFARATQLLHGSAREVIGCSPDLIAGPESIFGEDLSIHPRVTIGARVTLGNRVTLHSGTVIGDRCRIGDDTVVFANVSIYPNCEIGKRVVIHAGSVIGADGFGFVPDENRHQLKLLQLGRVLIEDDCEIGANCAIDRGGFGDTILHRGVKLDNLVQVGHNCEIGEDTVVAALSGFSGGTRVGKRCVIAGQVGTNQHITIGDDVIVTGQAGVTKNVKDGAFVSGTPARDHNAWRSSQVLYSRLPEMNARLRQLEDMVRTLKARLERDNSDQG